MIGSTDIGNIDIVANHSFTLSCNAAGYPAPTIVWRLDNNVLTNNNGLVIATNDPIMLSNGMQYVNSVLTVTNAEINNEGVYMCSFSNDAGTSNLTVATVDVKGIIIYVIIIIAVILLVLPIFTINILYMF